MSQKNHVEYVIKDLLKCRTYTEFADAVGVDRSEVARWKRRGFFSRKLLPRICEVTGLPVYVIDPTFPRPFSKQTEKEG